MSICSFHCDMLAIAFILSIEFLLLEPNFHLVFSRLETAAVASKGSIMMIDQVSAGPSSTRDAEAMGITL